MNNNKEVTNKNTVIPSLGFFKKRSARKRFLQLAGVDKLISLAEWQKAFESRNPLIAKSLFQLVDADGSGFIDESEYFNFIACLLDTQSDRRFQLVFDIYDLNGDGKLDEDEIRQILQASLDEQSLNVETDDLQELAGGFLRYFKSTGENSIQFTNFVSEIKNYGKTDRLFAQFTQLWLPKSSNSKKNKSLLTVNWQTKIKRGLSAKGLLYLWFTLYILANALLFYNAFSQYAAIGAAPAVQFARGFGACLNFNVALILLPIFRSLWTRIRHTFFRHLVPIDTLTEIHRGIGWFIVLFSVLHTAAHSINYWNNNMAVAVLFHNSAFITGVISSAILILMLWGVAYRSGRSRERFSGSHLLYGIFIIVILLHGPRFWIWFLLPASLYTLETLYRYLLKTRRVQVLEMQPLSDGVTLVRFAKPRNFSFYPGDYVRLKISNISFWQWHPFTISASPEADYFDVHIRNSGDWSGALHNLSRKRGTDPGSLKAYIDGPYGAPTSKIYRSPIAVMIAGGIGVTPFASALESLVMRNEASHKNKNGHEQVVYFHWLNRSQRSFEWFKKLLRHAENTLGRKFRLYIHLTSLSHNLTNIAMQIAAEEFYIKHKRDPFTSLQAVTNPGRPNWPELFSELAQRHPTQPVEVYFCGPEVLAKELRRHCHSYGFYFHQEKFD